MRILRSRNWWSRKAIAASLLGGGIIASGTGAFELAQPLDAQGIVVPLLMTTVYTDRLAQASIELSPDAPVEVLSIPDLPAGQYVVTGHISATNVDRRSWTYVTCFLMSDNTDNPRGIAHTFLAESRGGGVNPGDTMPLTGQVELSGSGRLSVACRQHPRGSAKITGGFGGFTQIIATRVG